MLSQDPVRPKIPGSRQVPVRCEAMLTSSGPHFLMYVFTTFVTTNMQLIYDPVDLDIRSSGLLLTDLLA